jgi:ABC-type branched-subunit amino acid transport system ATPase component
MLELEGVAAGYGLTRILHDVSLRVAEGEAVAILGRNGVGKTTLLKAIAGLIPVSKGRILVNGTDVTNVPAHQRVKNRVGYIGSEENIFPSLTVRENLMASSASSSRRQSGEIADQLLKEEYPALLTKASARASTLSGGQRRLLALARVMVRRPELMLLDEPTQGLQPSLVEELLQELNGLRARQNLTLVLVEQRLDFAARLVERAHLMVKGTLVKEMPMERLATDVEVQQVYLGV